MLQKVLVCGAGGFIGSHLVKRLKNDGFWVRGVDMKKPEFSETVADEFVIGDLRDRSVCKEAVKDCSDIYQLAADMGGMGFICGKHDYDILHNSALINLNMVQAARDEGIQRMLFTSSACIYPRYNQEDPTNPKCSEGSAYPADPDSEYGWEKLFAEHVYQAFAKETRIAVRIARLHNIFGPEGTWHGGREKAPAALCRKIAEVQENGIIEVWGDGKQTRSFLYIDECIEGIRRLMESDITIPLNIGSDEMITINDLVHLIANVAGKKISINNVKGPQGVRGRNSDNNLIRSLLCWAPSQSLRNGLIPTYQWIKNQVMEQKPLSVS
jgi:GDP-D-mannose 3', 5'-epimerase